MSDKKYNHYVPKFYLANFSGSIKFIDKCILSSGKIIRTAPTSSTGGKDYLYGKDGKLEDAFCELEGIWADIVKQIILTETIPNNPEDYACLLHFILLSENRTLAKANSTLAFWGENYRAMAKLLKRNGKIDLSDEVIDGIKAESPIPNLQDLQHDLFLMDICADLHITLIKNISELPFITSDHPVVKYNQLLTSNDCFRAYGYGQMGIQIFFPISPSLCLVLFDPIPYRLHYYYDGKFVVNDPSIIRTINTLIAGYANQEIYFSPTTSNRTISKILSKRIPNSLSPATGSLPAGNGFIIFLSDPSYLQKLDIPLFSVIKPFREMGFSCCSVPPLRPHAKEVKSKDPDYQNEE